LGSKLKCDEGTCNIFVEQNSGEVGLTGQVGARLWKKNWTSRVNLGKVAVGTNETILTENFATPSDMKP
jgi:hypothetical protein